MEQLIIILEGKTNAELLMRLLSKFNFVKSVTREKIPSADAANIVNEPATEYNWINPSRPATDEEIEQMLDECDRQYANGEFLTLEDSKSLTKKKIAEWKKKNIK